MAWDDVHEPGALERLGDHHGSVRPLLKRAIEVEFSPSPPEADIEAAWQDRVARTSPDGRPIAYRASRLEWRGVIAGSLVAVPAVLVMLYISAGWLAAGMGAVFFTLGLAIATAPAWGEVISDAAEEREVQAEVIRAWRNNRSG